MSSENKGDVFVNMFERRDIVDFVKEVEKHPCLYDNTSPDNLNRVLTKQAWTEIAKISGSTVIDCKEKWRKIRIAFMRSLKLGRSSNPPSRPYYLAEHLQFLMPFVKINEQEANPNSPDVSEDDHLEIEVPITKEEKFDHENSNDSFANGHSIFIEEHTNENLKRIKRNSKEVRQVVPVKRSCVDGFESNPRKLFLMSIMPEIESFTESEMRVFRRDVIESLDRVFSAREKSNV